MGLLVLQQRHEAKGSVEQPPRCVSRKLRASQQILKNNPNWQHFCWPSCAYGMQDPLTRAPWKKMQGFFANASLKLLCRVCTCSVRHGIIRGTIRSGPCRGERRTAISEEYPVRM